MSTFNVVATMIFGCAILHTFLSPWIYNYSRVLASKKKAHPQRWKYYHFTSEVLLLLGEVEVIFGIWLLPLFFWFSYMEGWQALVGYLNGLNFTDALYIMVIVVVIGSRPIVTFVESVLEWIARLGGDTPGAWWWTILTIGPLLGSLIKEPGAMAISAILLAKKFYHYKPSRLFQYATFGLLFVNVSVGGLLTGFASRALFVVTREWDWSSWYMLTHFGWKAIVGILLANMTYYFAFQKEFKRGFPPKLPVHEKSRVTRPTPLWITLLHLLFVAGIAITGEQAPLFIGIFILFLGFHKATMFYQAPLHLKSAILIGFFFASLIIHGELQGWWITPMLKETSYFASMGLSYLLSAVADNAIVGYLVLDVPRLDLMDKYLVIAGAMAAGGLTVVANAPNPIALSIFRPLFQGRISFFSIFLGALFPSFLMFIVFWVLRNVPHLS